MIYQSHHDFRPYPFAVHPCDECDPRAVKCQMRHFHFDKKLLPPPRGLKWKIKNPSLMCLLQWGEQSSQLCRHGNRKRPLLPAFWCAKGDFILSQIDIADATVSSPVAKSRSIPGWKAGPSGSAAAGEGTASSSPPTDSPRNTASRPAPPASRRSGSAPMASFANRTTTPTANCPAKCS